MKFFRQLLRQYAAEGVESGAGAAVIDPPQEEEEVQDDSKEEVVEDKGKTDEAEAKESEEADDELEIEGMEETEDGRIKYVVGNSIYLSKEGLKGNKAVSDVLKQERAATSEKDKAYQEMRKKTSEQKAAAAIKLPKTLDDEEEKLPDIPKHQAIVNHVFQSYQLRPEMAKWGDDDWIKHEDENGLRPWQITTLQREVEKAKQEATDMESGYVRQYNNALALRQSRDSVRDMVAGIEGVNPDDFAGDFHEILKRGMKGDGLNEFKELSPAWVVKEFGKVIGKTLTARQKSKLETDIQKKVLESQEQRRRTKPPITSAASFKRNEKTPVSIAEASKMIMDEWNKKT